MRSFIDEHRMLVVVGFMVIGFIFLVFMQQSSSDSGSLNDFKSVNASSLMYKGSNTATVSIIQYSDFLCPSCSIFSTQIMPKIETGYIDSSKVNFEFRPMAFIADGSLQAGMGGYCAIDQNKFWQYHDGVYAFVANKVFNEGKDPKTDVILTSFLVKDIAEQSGLEAESFNDCLDSKNHYEDIVSSTKLANKNGVNSTPYIMVNGQVYQGNMTLSAFEALIKAKL